MVKLELLLTKNELERLIDCVTNWCDMGPRLECWQSGTMAKVAEKVVAAAAYKQQQKEKQK